MPFEAEGWVSAGYFIRGRFRYRMWVPAPDGRSGDLPVEEWGVVISDRVSPARSLQILRTVPSRHPKHRRRGAS